MDDTLQGKTIPNIFKELKHQPGCCFNVKINIFKKIKKWVIFFAINYSEKVEIVSHPKYQVVLEFGEQITKFPMFKKLLSMMFWVLKRVGLSTSA